MSEPIIVFDMDGVLVEVTESYHEAIQQTVAHFTGQRPERDSIQDFKNQGGWNDDWQLSHHIINEAGVNASLADVTAQFQKLFLGSNGDGLIRRERWVAQPGKLEKLNSRYRFALFTGRPVPEARLTLDRFAPELRFDPIVGMYEVNHPKPDPEGLLFIQNANPNSVLIYVGDSVDDARASRAAGVPFIGVAAPSNPRYLDLIFLFQEEKAAAIVDDINFLDEVLEV
jgi:HAD superfamily phosphatase